MTKLMAWLRRIALSTGAVLFAVAGTGGGAAAQGYEDIPLDELRAGIAEQHPLAYYVLASRLMGEDDDEAVFWFYAGQLRYRVLLSCAAVPTGADEAILFNALSESLGRPVNEYAFGDIDTLVATIEAVLAWDEAAPGGPVPKQDCAETFEQVRAGLETLRDEIVDGADEIRYQRRLNGLENRT